MPAMNRLLIVSGQPNAYLLSASAHHWVGRPSLDTSEGSGIRLQVAYCISPLSLPDRAALGMG